MLLKKDLYKNLIIKKVSYSKLDFEYCNSIDLFNFLKLNNGNGYPYKYAQFFEKITSFNRK